jgi:hypothetical protein
MRAPQPGESTDIVAPRRLTLGLEAGTWKMIDEKAAQEGVSADELITFSVLYYLADLDSGRISRQISRSPYRRPAAERPSGDADRGPSALSAESFRPR